MSPVQEARKGRCSGQGEGHLGVGWPSQTRLGKLPALVAWPRRCVTGMAAQDVPAAQEAGPAFPQRERVTVQVSSFILSRAAWRGQAATVPICHVGNLRLGMGGLSRVQEVGVVSGGWGKGQSWGPRGCHRGWSRVCPQARGPRPAPLGSDSFLLGHPRPAVHPRGTGKRHPTVQCGTRCALRVPKYGSWMTIATLYGRLEKPKRQEARPWHSMGQRGSAMSYLHPGPPLPLSFK